MSDDNKAKMREFYNEVMQKGNFARLDELIAPAFVDHQPAPGQAPGAEGVKQFVTAMRAALTGLHVTVEHIVAEGDTVVTEHTETWHFHTGEVIALPFVSVMEISGGMIRLWRDYSDLNTLLSKAPAWWLEHIAKFTVADFAPG